MSLIDRRWIPGVEPVTTLETQSGSALQTASKIRIALADDHVIFRDGLSRLLSLEPDFEVVAEAADGVQVLSVIEKHRPDILLLDVRMPGLDGLSALQRMHLGTRTRVILLTASENNDEFVKGMKLGASGIVLKQAGTERLFESIRRVHAGEISLDAQTRTSVIRQLVAGNQAPPQPQPVPRKRESLALSRRERECVALVAQGFKNRDVAEKLGVSEQTVKNQLVAIFEKSGSTDRLDLALYAVCNNLVPTR